MRNAPTGYKAVYYHTISGKGIIPSATIRLENEGNIPQSSSVGDKPIDAMFNAMNKVTGLDTSIVEFDYRLTDSRDYSVNLMLRVNGWDFRGHGEGSEAVDAAVNAYLSALNKSIGARKPRPYSDFDGHGILMFVYVPDADTTRAISVRSYLDPQIELGSMLSGYGRKPFVNLTDVRPEEGRKAVIAARPQTAQPINYGLEVVVDGRSLKREFWQFPRWFQIFSEEPVPIKVVATREMDKMGRGVRIKRFFDSNGNPHSHYV